MTERRSDAALKANRGISWRANKGVTLSGSRILFGGRRGSENLLDLLLKSQISAAAKQTPNADMFVVWRMLTLLNIMLLAVEESSK